MSNSPLVTYTKISPNRTSPRNHAIDRITIHCYVGQVTAERGCSGGRFTTYDSKNGSSCNYVVGRDGSVGLCVEETDRSWCSSNSANDHRAITMEVASDSAHPYAVTDAALQATIDLCEDVCRRYGKKKLLWFGDREKTLAYTPKPDEMALTVHRWFAAKACPGNYLYTRHGMIAEEVTKRLNKEEEMRYNKIAEVPAYAQDTIRKMVNSGLIGGSGMAKDEEGFPADLDLSLDMIRVFVIHDRAGVYGG